MAPPCCWHGAVKYEVRLAGGKDALAASPAEGAVVAVGSGQPLKAFQVALKSMKEGERATLQIKPECTPLGSSWLARMIDLQPACSLVLSYTIPGTLHLQHIVHNACMVAAYDGQPPAPPTDCAALLLADGFAAGAGPDGVPADAELEADLELLVIRKVRLSAPVSN